MEAEPHCSTLRPRALCARPKWVNNAIRGFPGEGPLDLNKQTFWKLTDQFDRAMMS